MVLWPNNLGPGDEANFTRRKQRSPTSSSLSTKMSTMGEMRLGYWATWCLADVHSTNTMCIASSYGCKISTSNISRDFDLEGRSEDISPQPFLSPAALAETFDQGHLQLLAPIGIFEAQVSILQCHIASSLHQKGEIKNSDMSNTSVLRSYAPKRKSLTFALPVNFPESQIRYYLHPQTPSRLKIPPFRPRKSGSLGKTVSVLLHTSDPVVSVD
ncbi:hypothetical protein EJ08DRAFT_139523 [Tothia fuscella]|uniref:Uncharacterized protein n=1 Tax=Tothia fuscella TaxID=1048955 RepID=A0A9P4NV18_9PEZI|nr:hypothetical protein EJ08DRAFT_139523 [Tothia fuscella]